MSVYAMKIGSGNSEITLKPDAIKPSDNALDSEKSGRDNSSGTMFRDKIAEKLKYTVEMPSGMTNTEVSAILAIILAPQFSATVPNIRTGSFDSTKNFYCSGCEPEIELITSSGWTYKAWSFSMTEM